MLSKKSIVFLPTAVKTRLQSPALYPIIGHIVRDISRRISLLSTDVSNSQNESSRMEPTPSAFFREFNELSPNFNKDIRSLLKEIQWIDKARMDEYFPEYKFNKSDDKVSLTLKLPKGVKREDVQVEVKNNKELHIFGQKNEKKDDGWESKIKFDRQLSFGDEIDSSSIVASLVDGVLKVQFPLLPKVEPVTKKVSIE